MVDYAKRIADLRRLGAPGSGATEAERKLANERADELEAKHRERVTESSPFTNHTTTTSRDGRGWYSTGWEYDQNVRSPGGFRFTKPNPKPGEDPEFDRRTRQAWDEVWNLFHRQAQWNKVPDEDDLIADEWKHDAEDEDYGYDIFEGEEYE